MTPEQFVYWLQGFVELHGDEPTPTQWLQIKDHLSLVFNKVTPTRPSMTIPPAKLPTQFDNGFVLPQMPPSYFDYDGTFLPPKIIC